MGRVIAPVLTGSQSAPQSVCELEGMRPQLLCETNVSSPTNTSDLYAHQSLKPQPGGNLHRPAVKLTLSLDLRCGQERGLIINVSQKSLNVPQRPLCFPLPHTEKFSYHCLISCFGQSQLLLFSLLPLMVSLGTSPLCLSLCNLAVVVAFFFHSHLHFIKANG